jgi:mRNA-degrading endonuclease RelE of RelBE toxin-antitoxin system
MRYSVRLTASAADDLSFFAARERRIIADAMVRFLEVDAEVASHRRKQLRPNPVSPWELRAGEYRVFYEIAGEGVVRVLAIGYKVHSELHIRGHKVEL